MTKDLFSFHFSVVLIEWVQAAHLQGKDDPDHQVWNQGYKSKYVVLLNEAVNSEKTNESEMLSSSYVMTNIYA